MHAVVGGSASLKCVTDVTDKRVEWKQTKNISTSFPMPVKIYCQGRITNGYTSRFNVTKVDGTSVLHIWPLELSDFGTYECTDDDGYGKSAEAELIRDTVYKQEATTTLQPPEILIPPSRDIGKGKYCSF